MTKTTQTISGWSWATLSEFNIAKSETDDALGYPKELPGFVTLSSIDAFENLDTDDSVLFYYLGYDDQLLDILGEPSTFDINIYIP